MLRESDFGRRATGILPASTKSAAVPWPDQWWPPRSFSPFVSKLPGLVWSGTSQLTPKKRQFLYDHIHKIAMAIGVGSVDCQAVDTLGIIRETEMAMKQAIDQLSPSAEVLLIDFMSLPEVKLPQRGIVDGDSRCFSIACASIIAKVTRDRLMTELDGVYPGHPWPSTRGMAPRSTWPACADSAPLLSTAAPFNQSGI